MRIFYAHRRGQTFAFLSKDERESFMKENGGTYTTWSETVAE